MTTSYQLGYSSLMNIYSMYLGLWEAIHEKKQGDYEDLSKRISRIEQGIQKIKGFGLWSIEEYFNYDPQEWINGLKDIIAELRKENPNLDNKIREIEATLPEIQRLMPLPVK